MGVKRISPSEVVGKMGFLFQRWDVDLFPGVKSVVMSSKKYSTALQPIRPL